MDNLLAYGSDDDGRSCRGGDDLHPTKKARLPAPLPTVVPPEPDDKHKGKIRSFPHVEGNYPSHVYIPVVVRYQSIGFNLYRKAPKSHSLHTLVDRLLATQSVKLEPYEGDMHVSLSRPFALRQMQITPFADSLRRLCVLPRLRIELTRWRYFVNDERTRSFLALTFSRGKQEVLELLKHVDTTMRDFAQPVYYQNPEPHVTIGWALGDIVSAMSVREAPLDSPCIVEVQRVECKIGKYVYEYDLK